MSLSQVFAHGSHPSTSSLSSWPTVTCWTTCVSVTARRSTPWCCSTWPLRFPLQWSTWRRRILFTGKWINQNTAQCTFIVLNWSSFKLHSYSSVFWGLLFNRNRNIPFFCSLLALLSSECIPLWLCHAYFVVLVNGVVWSVFLVAFQRIVTPTGAHFLWQGWWAECYFTIYNGI